MTAKSSTKEYLTWGNMIARCTNPNRPDYARYGGIGVTVCDEWRKSFDAFIAHIGWRPSEKHSLDRIDGTRGYEPGNVRWATAIEQANNKRTNRRVVYHGTEMTVAEACRVAGGAVRNETAICRLGNGWSVEDAVETPPLFRREPETMRKIKVA